MAPRVWARWLVLPLVAATASCVDLQDILIGLIDKNPPKPRSSALATYPSPRASQPAAYPSFKASMPPPLLSGPETLLLKLESIAGVSDNPPVKTILNVAGPAHVTKIMTYHWNSGVGMKPGTIGLKHAGTGAMLGPWSAVGVKRLPDMAPGGDWSALTEGPPYLYWLARPDADIPAGTYEVVDSDPATWSYTGDVGNRGIAWIYGRGGKL